jgi:threonyl-tRNA synthetase
VDYAKSIHQEIRQHGVRAELDLSADKVSGKILRAEQMKVHTMFVLGKRDVESNSISVRIHGKGNLGPKPRDAVVTDILKSIRERLP